MQSRIEKLVVFLIVLVSFVTPILHAIAAGDVFLAQSAVGAGDGSSCAAARPVAGTTWTAGTTYHLCGTLTAPVVPNANGTSAALIKIVGEPGSRISMPAIPGSGAIPLTGRQWIEVDGQHNLIIESTANGTATGRVNSVGVEVTGSNLSVHGITFQNLYKYVCCGNDQGGIGVSSSGSGTTNVRVYDNIFMAMFAGIEMQLGANTSNIELDHNTIPNSDVAWGIVPVQGFSNSSTNGLLIHDNDITPGSGAMPGSGNSWCTGTTDFNHLDPIHTWSQGTGGGIVGELIYNNRIHGSFCVVNGVANSTAAIFWEAHVDGGSAPNTATVFNNLIEMQGGHPGDGAIFVQSGTNGNVYNNTIDCTGADNSGIGTEFGGGTVAYSNNIIFGCKNNGILKDGGTVTGNNNNCFGNGASGPNGATCIGTAQIINNPVFDVNHVATAGASATGGANLTSLNIVQLDTSQPLAVGAGNLNAVGSPRPSTGGWSVGSRMSGTVPPPLQPPVITSASSAVGTDGVPFSYQITATNNPTSFSATGLPANLTFSTSTGLISGTPIAVGITSAMISATNAAGTGTAPLTITINAAPPPQAPIITSSSTANGSTGTAFSYQITATNSPTSFGAIGLPANLTVNTSTGRIAGTPAAAGTTSATMSATNSTGTGTAPLTITISSTPPPNFTMSVTPKTLAFSGTVGNSIPCQNIVIDDTTPNPLPVTLTTSGQFAISTTPASGNTKLMVSVCVKTAGLVAGSYTGTVTITDGTAVNNSPLGLPVTLTLSGTPPPPLTIICTTTVNPPTCTIGNATSSQSGTVTLSPGGAVATWKRP